MVNVAATCWSAEGKARILLPLLLCAAVALSTPPAHSLAATPASSVADLTTLLRRLSSDDFSERTEAQQKLSQLARQAPEEIASLYDHADPETQTRILQLLEGVFLNNNNETGDRAEQALQALAEAGSKVAEGILIGNARLRESRAREAIERLGGRFTYIHPAHDSSALAPLTGIGFGEPAVLKVILIPEDWKGTPEDLWHLKRFSHHHNLKIFNIRGSRVTTQDLWPLAANLSGLQVEERGACLGIQATPGATTAEVLKVVENSAAEAANLQANDQIEKLDGQIVRNFSHLVELLTHYRPGDRITLQIRRNGETMDVPVTLGSWKDVMRSELPAVDPPAFFAGPLGKSHPPAPKPPEPLPYYPTRNSQWIPN